MQSLPEADPDESGYSHHRRRGQLSSRPLRRISPVGVLLTLAGVLALIGGVGAVVVVTQHGRPDRKAAAPAPTGGAGNARSPNNDAASGGIVCQYLPSTGPPEGRRIAPTPEPRATVTGRLRITLATNHGEVEVELDADAAPCTVNSFLSLAHSGFYTGNTCSRLTTDTIYVVQCGDPTDSGWGGPGYQYGDENLPIGRKPAYPRGTVAMANAGPGTNGSQFFLVYNDSDIDPNYSVFGTVTRGLDVLDLIAVGGTDDSNGPGDGHPKLDLTISRVG
jgi:peptidyl-prolyl cis-trans isomerase B (cyclophilin B)